MSFRRGLATALLTLTIAGTMTLNIQTANAEAWRWDFCRFQYTDNQRDWSVSEVRRTIRCAVEHFPVDGGLPHARYIAYRESHYFQYADNPTSSASGVYQIVSGTWAGFQDQLSRFYRSRWAPKSSVFNARSNVLTAIRWVHTHSWSPWGG